ncbi:MAG TPA: M28 family peptidase [Bryobacteraceae bacterium]
MMRPAILLLITTLSFATEPNAATKRWWTYTTALSNDGMRGRNTGSEDYNRAAEYVATQFARLGLKPAGTLGYFQSVPLKSIRLVPEESEAAVVNGGKVTNLAWFRQITTRVHEGMPLKLDAPMVFVGTESEPGVDLKGKVAVMLDTPRFIAGIHPYSRKLSATEGALATITIPSVEGPEPMRWPVSYAVTMSIDGAPSPARPESVPAFSLNASAADVLLAGSPHNYEELLSLAKAGKPVPSFALPSNFRSSLKLAHEFFASDNIIAVLPGSDPKLADEYVAVSAHLDGYGIGEPWHGDNIYNGAFDDAAYVATLIDFADHLKETHRALKRSILFCVVTGEEKGLLGSRYFAANPTVDKSKIVADINLDILRPIFPLKILTVLGLKMSTLGETATKVGTSMGIRVQEDLEPLRGLIRRSDHMSFMQIGVPSLGFVFGYEPGSPEEVVYRKWYLERYHTPADDLKQPWVPQAAAKFNEFFARMVETVADTAERPRVITNPVP